MPIWALVIALMICKILCFLLAQSSDSYSLALFYVIPIGNEANLVTSQSIKQASPLAGMIQAVTNRQIGLK